MDSEKLFYIALVVFWAVSQLASLAKKRKSRERPRPSTSRPTSAGPAPATAPAPSSWDREGIAMLESLQRLETRTEAGMEKLDPRARTQLQYELDSGIESEAKAARDSLESAVQQGDTAAIYRALSPAQGLAARLERLLKAAGTLSAVRRRAENARPLRVADELLEQVVDPMRSFAMETRLSGALPPPSAVVWDPDDETRASPLARSTLFVPRSVTVDPLHWALTAQEVSRLLASFVPGLYREVFDALELQVTDAELETNRAALSRLLFGSFLARILGDAVGACLFGPVYLRALGKLYQEPGAVARVTTIYLNQDGTVYPEPPAHLRMHLTAEWLTEMGFSVEAQEALAAWTETHGEPGLFSFYGTLGTVPADTLLGISRQLMAGLYYQEFQELGARTLPTIPGLADTGRVTRVASQASPVLASGERTAGPIRAVLAAAMAATLAEPGASSTIREALYDSAAGAAVAPTAARVRSAASAGARGVLQPTPRAIAEALILGEILLEPRRR